MLCIKDKINMSNHNTLYIAEPIFSEKLQSYGSDIKFPPIKKIGITTDHPKRREKELLGTTSPVKIAIVKAWTKVNARALETTLHNILDNSRLDGEYFWDGNESLVEAVSNFIASYHPEAEEIIISEDADVKAASKAADKLTTNRVYGEIIPFIEKLKIKYTLNMEHTIVKNGKAVRLNMGKYNGVIHVRTGGKYTFTIYSKTKTSDDALSDFPGSQELSDNSTGGSDRKARIPLTTMDVISESIKQYLSKVHNKTL